MNISTFPVLMDGDLKLPFYITSAGEWDHQEPILRKQGFPDYQWIQCYNGKGELAVDGKTYAVEEGQGMLLFPKTPHTYVPLHAPWSVKWISFNGTYVEDLLSSLGFASSRVLCIYHPKLILQKMQHVITMLNLKNPVHGLECSALTYEIILDIYKYASGSEIRSKQHHFEQLTPAFHYIEQHYGEAISLQQLAEELSVSPQHTCLLFQQTIGVRPFEYMTRFRLRKAKELLLNDVQIAVKDIANQVGYEHPSYFIKVFKRHEGITPSMFRKMHKRGS